MTTCRFYSRPAAALLQTSCGDWSRVADGVAGYDQFDSAVLLPSGRAIVRGHGQSIAEAFRAHGIGSDALLYEVSANRTGTILRQSLVHDIAADVIGVSTDFDIETRVGEQDAGNFGQLLARTRCQGILSSVKKHIGHADDKTSCCITSLKNRVQLLRQARTHGRFIGLRLLSR